MSTPTTSAETASLYLDNRLVPINGARNLLELARKAGIDIPTFCYHSSLSVYGACRMCLVDIEGRGIVASCSTAPAPGMRVRTNTDTIRKLRRIALELLLANHESDCPSCPKSADCRLLELSRRLGVDRNRYKSVHSSKPVDTSSPSLLRNPNKCILCGDCVRACNEVQSVGAIDFAYRGASSAVLPAFGKDLGQVECVNCGQCAAVCPTGALTPRPEIDGVWKALHDPAKTVVVQVAPAVRAGLGEHFGMPAGTLATGPMVAALKRLGFDAVYDTSFAADLTVLEEANEFLGRFTRGERLPQFTSCCPAWVQFTEQYFPELLPKLSSCKSPQQMFGSLCRELLPEMLNKRAEDIVVVSLMPCTAKKSEARLDKFKREGRQDVDFVITTQEAGRMIQEAGIDFSELESEAFDLPLGFRTGAGVLFGATGGVTEAVLRYAATVLSKERLHTPDFHVVRGQAGVREATVNIAGKTLKVAVVHGLANARKVAERVLAGTCDYDLIEVMACPGGCVAGAGQPPAMDVGVRAARAEALYREDKLLPLQCSQDNFEVHRCYEKHLGEIGGEHAHHLLHTAYRNRRRIEQPEFTLIDGESADRVEVAVCVGTTCFLKGSQSLLKQVAQYVEENDLESRVHLHATFCCEGCGHAPNVQVGDTLISGATPEKVCGELARLVESQLTPAAE